MVHVRGFYDYFYGRTSQRYATERIREHNTFAVSCHSLVLNTLVGVDDINTLGCRTLTIFLSGTVYKYVLFMEVVDANHGLVQSVDTFFLLKRKNCSTD